MDDLEVVGRAIFDEDQLREFANRPLTVHEFLDDVTYAEHDDSSELSSDDDVDDDDEYIREHVVEVDITSQNKKFVDKKIGILQSIPTTMNIADPISELISLPPVEGPHCALSSGSVSVELNPHQVGVVSVFLRNLGTVALILTWTRDNSSGIVHVSVCMFVFCLFYLFASVLVIVFLFRFLRSFLQPPYFFSHLLSLFVFPCLFFFCSYLFRFFFNILPFGGLGSFCFVFLFPFRDSSTALIFLSLNFRLNV